MFTDKQYQSPPTKHFNNHESFNQSSPQECPYCLIKQKLSTDGEPQRCLKHSIAYQNSFSAQSNSDVSSNIIEEALDLLRQVQQILDQYWNNLHKYSGGSVGKVRQQMNPVFEAINAIEQKLSRFPMYSQRTRFSYHQEKRSLDGYFSEQKKSNKRERVKTSTFLKYDELFEDSSVNDQIKEWVIYFQKILVNRQIRDQLLPFDDQIDMRIFKESMERKFMTFASTYDKYEKRLTVALEKLLFYMQSCNNVVNDQQIKQDISFIEDRQLTKSSAQKEMQLLFIQALTIQDLLRSQNDSSWY